MASLQDTKRRIASVKNTQKITRAMKLVASAKYARANVNLAKAKPYAEAFEGVLQSVLASDNIKSELLNTERKEKAILYVIVATDRGLCGPLNSQLFRSVEKILEKHTKNHKVLFELWGKRAIFFGKKQDGTILFEKEKVLEQPPYLFAKEAVKRYHELYMNRKIDAVHIAYSSFKNAMSHPPKVKQLIPMKKAQEEMLKKAEKEPLFEPSQEEMVDKLLVQHAVSQVHKVLLESSASEHSARMTAMDSATNNADKVIKSLTLEYNRARQASITKELIEITSGAEALH